MTGLLSNDYIKKITLLSRQVYCHLNVPDERAMMCTEFSTIKNSAFNYRLIKHKLIY